MYDAVRFILFFMAVIMITVFIACGIWWATSEKQKPIVYTYYKKDFDDMWETINSWCVKYCNKEFPRYHDEIFLGKSEISYESHPYELEKKLTGHIVYT